MKQAMMYVAINPTGSPVEYHSIDGVAVPKLQVLPSLCEADLAMWLTTQLLPVISGESSLAYVAEQFAESSIIPVIVFGNGHVIHEGIEVEQIAFIGAAAADRLLQGFDAWQIGDVL
jgi:hypothetical protein